MGGGEPATDPGPLAHVNPLDVWLNEHGLPSNPDTPTEASTEGPPVPHVLLHMVGEFMIHKGAGAAVVGGWVIVAGSVIWEAFHFGSWLGELVFGEDEAEQREARRQAWRHFMSQNFWVEYPPLSNALREAAFDRLAGDQASHGVVPLMTRDALFEALRMQNEISDRWLGHMTVIKALEEYIAKGPPYMGYVAVPDHPDYPSSTTLTIDMRADSYNQQKAVEAARAEIEYQKKAMADEMEALVDFETDPANWALTPEQQAMLPDKPAGS